MARQERQVEGDNAERRKRSRSAEAGQESERCRGDPWREQAARDDEPQSVAPRAARDTAEGKTERGDEREASSRKP
jgi:hypothetical protein